MSLTRIRRAAARSAARQKKKTSPPPLEPAPPAPAGVVKTSPKGKSYRVLTIPLMDLPAFLEREGLEPKTYFRFAPEVEFDEDGKEIPFSGWFLGVRRKGEKENREL